MEGGNLADLIRGALGRIENPFALFTAGDERIYWVYLLWAVLIAGVVFIRSAPGKASLTTFLRFAFPSSIYWSRSARVDYGWFLLCRPILALLLAPTLVLFAPAISEAMTHGLRTSLPGLQDSLQSSYPMIAVFTIVAIVVSDFSGFLAHTLQHRVPFLWEFHKVHHSAESLTPITVYRMHPVDDILVLVFGGLGLAATTALFQFMTVGPLNIVSAFGMNVFALAFFLFGSNLRHTHLWIDYGPHISRILISPAQHQIHHSQDPVHRDRNMGFIFAFWDRLFGSLYVPQTRESIRFGIGDGEEREFSNPFKLFWLPFYNVFRRRGPATAALGAFACAGLLALSVSSAAVVVEPAAPDLVHLEDLTWVEVQAKLAGGTDTVLVPTAGNEQNGPHVVLGKHEHVVRYAAGRIARELGNTLVAPVVTYAPEGSIEPREGHMRFAGTISVPPETFEAILEHTARSLRAHGFERICFIGDSGPNQESQARVAQRLNVEWKDELTRVIHVESYYAANGQIEWLLEQGVPEPEIGGHAGVRDTSELLYVHPEGVREDLLFVSAHDGARGVNGDPTRASREIGKQMIDLKVRAAVEQIRAPR
jgi:sterol desaturase/sphingolipid hydroxylase (fatty acid hydroxylase superfamily)/creatinine amidohydrolase/Fe(II)-dependent formamide hydrolase-like protein